MAADFFLAEKSRKKFEPILRLYGWARPTVSLGFHQKVSFLAEDRCREAGVPVVVRPTGGRAVLHDRELTYCFCLPLEHPLCAASRNELLKSIGTVFVVAASKIGLEAELVRAGSRSEGVQSTKRKSPLCFDATSRWEVRLGGQKWIGSAQRFFPGVMLQHGSILLAESDVNLSSLFGTGDRHRLDDADLQKSQSFPNGFVISEIALRRAIVDAFAEQWSILWRQESLSPTEIKIISLLMDNNFCRSEIGDSTQLRQKWSPQTITLIT